MGDSLGNGLIVMSVTVAVVICPRPWRIMFGIGVNVDGGAKAARCHAAKEQLQRRHAGAENTDVSLQH